MIVIPLHRLTGKNREMVRQAVVWNLTPDTSGQGNRAKRRAGLAVIDRTANHPQGMNAEQKSAWLKTWKK